MSIQTPLAGKINVNAQDKKKIQHYMWRSGSEIVPQGVSCIDVGVIKPSVTDD